ncbi:calcium-binding protein [Tabrizicola oligotrophica]|uniref:Calcium-binding protein n=1 Tax=Tabrizicola oligotrophica TaxID=2710650 RepID=A0A6M0QXZ1_9RHOB|nr:calcium-binding protein [Tabrizicola oligotrophica]NEY91603.1 calcium-binding protein [Tabrizicola oligotrophica]
MADLYTGGATVAGTIAYFNSFVEILVADGDSTSPVSLELTDSGTIDLTVHLDTRAVTLQAFTGDDHITTSVGDDVIYGNGGNDTLIGFDGNDTLVGGAGDDSLVGGTGDDVFVLSGENEGQDVFLGSSGADELRLESAGPLALQWLVVGAGAAIESFNLNGVTLTGTTGADLFDLSGIAGYTADNAIDLDAGNDLFRGVQGDDHASGGEGDDSLAGNSGNDWLAGGTGRDTLNGGAGDDVLVLGAGDPGLDSLIGGTGTDQLLLDQTLTALSRLTLNATASVEVIAAADTLVLSGAGSDVWDLSGVSSYVTGFAIDMGAGSDSLSGTAAADVVQGGDDRDTLGGNAGDDALSGGNGDDSLTGGLGDDSLFGEAGNDSLTGSDGADLLTGGTGDDTYVIGLGDQVIERAAGGHDRIVLQGLSSFTLTAQVEDLLASGAGAVMLRGNGLDNALSSGSGNDRLDGRAGADTLAGGAGDDIYVVDNHLDVILETSDGGRDSVRTDLASYTLALRVETLTGTNAAGQALTGNALSNTILGGAGADTLAGALGEDLLRGGAGDDLYLVDSLGDQVIEALAGGLDTVQTALASYTLGRNFETLIGTRANGQTLDGNSADNSIQGGAGGDQITGLGGNDTLTGGGGADSFVFRAALGAGNLDHIVDFAAEDRIVLENTGPARFHGLAPGALAADAFKIIGPAGGPVDANDRILYNSTTGELFFDADGSGGLASVQFATLDGQPLLAAADFLVI